MLQTRIIVEHVMIISPPGIAKPPAGSRFTDVTFSVLNIALSFDNGWTDRRSASTAASAGGCQSFRHRW